MDGAHCQKGAGILRAHSGYSSFALCRTGTGQTENNR